MDDALDDRLALMAVIGMFGEALGLSDEQIGAVINEAHETIIAKLREQPAPSVERVYEPTAPAHVN